ncbi:MAG: helix-turn-helix domain-containing protein [Candidatus Moranbacteria bacterium]|nr:helix-turn-helix domain-containing protein [Candidatus Moranbacteria bacterium]
MLEKEFAQLGLNENEREVYLAVLRAGKIAPARVAKETSINRTTVYSISRKLDGLGLISEDLGAKVAYLYAEKPAALEQMFAKEETLLKKRLVLAKKMSKDLAALPSQATYSVPKIKFVEEADLNDYLYKQYPLWAKSGLQRDNTWWGYHDHTFTESYSKYVDWLWKHGPRNQKVRFFTNEAMIEEKMRKKYPERQYKILPAENNFDSSFWIIGDYVIMGQTRNRPHYLVEIHDPLLARNQRELFKVFWTMAHTKIQNRKS